MNGYEKEINSREEQKNKIRARYRGVDRTSMLLPVFEWLSNNRNSRSINAAEAEN